jgi:hypothetical protein
MEGSFKLSPPSSTPLLAVPSLPRTRKRGRKKTPLTSMGACTLGLLDALIHMVGSTVVVGVEVGVEPGARVPVRVQEEVNAIFESLGL